MPSKDKQVIPRWRTRRHALICRLKHPPHSDISSREPRTEGPMSSGVDAQASRATAARGRRYSSTREKKLRPHQLCARRCPSLCSGLRRVQVNMNRRVLLKVRFTPTDAS